MRFRLVPSCVRIALLLSTALAVGIAGVAHAEPVTPAAPAASAQAHPIRLAEAVQMARTRGYDIVLASAQVRGAEADVTAAGAMPNPSLNGNVGWTLSCAAKCGHGTPWGWGVGVSDQGLIEGALTQKRVLRQRVAERALDAARHGRVDAERVIVAQTKIQYIQAASAAAKVDFVREVATSLAKSVEVNRMRYPRVIDEGQLFRVEQEALKADQDVDRTLRDLRQQQIELAFLIGNPSGEVTVDKDAVRFRVPEALAGTTKEALFEQALEDRPDRRAALAREAQSDAQMPLARRQRIPDISLNAQYAQQGTLDYSSQLPTLTVGASLPLPLFYRMEGEIRRAEADREAAEITLRRIDAALASEIDASYNAFVTARALVERYESGLLEKAKKARDITEVQFNAGGTRLTDLLDAQRSFVQVNIDYQDELVNYWTAVFQLEQAVGKELVP